MNLATHQALADSPLYQKLRGEQDVSLLLGHVASQLTEVREQIARQDRRLEEALAGFAKAVAALAVPAEAFTELRAAILAPVELERDRQGRPTRAVRRMDSATKGGLR